MNKNIIKASIFSISTIMCNVFSENNCISKFSFIAFSSGFEALKISDEFNTNPQFGVGFDLHLHLAKKSGIMMTANFFGSHLSRDEFNSIDRSIGSYVYGWNKDAGTPDPSEFTPGEKKTMYPLIVSSKDSGIKNSNIGFSIGIGNDIILSKEYMYFAYNEDKNCYCTNFGFGINLGIELNYSKNKNKFSALDDSYKFNSLKISMKQSDIHSWKAGIFMSLISNSEKFLSFIFGEFGSFFYGKGVYKFDVSFIDGKPNEKNIGTPESPPDENGTEGYIVYESVPVPLYSELKINTKDKNGIYVNLSIGFSYKIFNKFHIGAEGKLAYSYKSTKTNKDAVFSSYDNTNDPVSLMDIFYKNDIANDINVHYYPVKKDDEFNSSLLNNTRGSIHVICMYIGV